VDHPLDDTIAALATAPGGGVGIIRLSGPRALALVRAHFRGLPRRLAPRRLVHGTWCAADGTPLDEGLCVVFPGPASFTGEDVAELHLHGGALNLRTCLAVCLDAGARLATPGEFTRRAFLNGKLDLTRAEAIADLVGAQTDRALEQARAHLQGRLQAVALAAREGLLRLRAQLELNLDFPDEDVPVIDPAPLAADARALARDLAALAATHRHGRLLRAGARVVLVGRPNAGKSSLFNALLESDRAIVTPTPGTTRDVVDEAVDMLGVPVVLVDTAGLRAPADPVEAHGVARTSRALADADLALVVVNPFDPPAPDAEVPAPPPGVPVVTVHTHADLPGAPPPPPGALAVAAPTGAGLPALRSALVAALGGADAPPAGSLVIARERQRADLARAARALTDAADALDAGAPPELAAVDLLEAQDALGALVGLTTIEDVLDRLFATFCIGK